MKRRILSLALTALLLFSFLFSAMSCKKRGGDTDDDTGKTAADTVMVRFMTNTVGEITLSSGRKGIADSVLFAVRTVPRGSAVTAPEEVPVHQGYDFLGWATDAGGTTLWDFSEPVNGSVALYAKWQRTAESAGKDNYTEPALSFTETVSAGVDGVELTGILHIPAVSGRVELTAAGIRRLSENAEDVREYLTYRRNPDTTVTGAVYADGTVTLTAVRGGETLQKTLTVTDKTAALAVSNSTYESKAQKYEKTVSIAPYGVLLGGSSSMENWSSSDGDMAPVTTDNVGIGGTTVVMWRDQLAERLLYPFSPRAVVLYVGINDIINAGRSGEETGAALQQLFDAIHEHLPRTDIYYVLINYVPGYYRTYGAHITRANDMVTEYARHHDFLTLIDAGSVLMKPSGIPNAACFLTDGLHMSLCGYALWGEKIREAVMAHETEKYGTAVTGQ